MNERFPQEARFVIIGGGVIGCATAYHLAREGASDVVLLERAKLTSGSTWHAAGAVAQYRPNVNLMRLASYAVEIIPKLEEETGQATGWRQTGGMRVAATKERRAEYERTITAARSFGLEMELISPQEAREKFPFMNVDDLDSALWVPSDGLVSPSDVTMALAKGARKNGARIIEETTVEGFVVKRGRLEAVVTNRGTIRCESAAICAGIWSRRLGRLAGAAIPIWPSRHCYMITEPIEGVTPDLPVMRDPDLWHYVREEVGGLMVGQYDPDPVPFESSTVPDDYVFHLEPEDLDHFLPRMLPLIKRVPVLETVGVKSWIHGLEAFTEDQNPVLGPTPEVEGLYTASGFNAYGISVGPGFGMALGQWMLNGEPPFDLWQTDIRRFAPYHGSDAQVRTRALEGQGHHYRIHFPFEEMTAGRPLRRSALHERLRAGGACFGTKYGWERPNWFAPEGVAPKGVAPKDVAPKGVAPKGVAPKDAYGFARPNWFAYAAEEHRACREGVALFDMSSFSKFLLVGRDAESVLQHIAAGDVAKPPGRIIYTQMLNAKGGIECDLTVARLSEEAFYIVTGTAFANHDAEHIRRHMGQDARAQLLDMTSAFGALALMGPFARDVLREVAEGDFDNGVFPFGHLREIHIAGAPVRAMRITFVGELGWELHLPSEYMPTVYDALKRASIGIKDAGYRAIDSLRLEKGYRVWGVDIGPDDTPLEAGLGFALAFKKPVDFIGKAALVKQRAEGLKKRLVTFSLEDPEAFLLGRETVYRDGVKVGWITSGNRGVTVGREIGLGWVRNERGVGDDFLQSGRYELEIALARYPAALHLAPLYDPGNARVRS